MSHFTVCVITKDGDYEKALAPYDEEIQVEPYISETKAQIIQKIKDRKARYDEGIARGEEDSWFEEHYGNVNWDDDESIHAAYVELWKEDEKCDEEGNELTTDNPKSKWDWYSLGGRWGGTLKLKEGAEIIKDSEPSLIYPSYIQGGYTDFAQVKDIDFSPNKEAKKHAERFWDINVLGKPIESEEEKKEYWTPYNKKYYKDQYGSKKEYVRCQIELMTYAFIYEDKWYEPGEMGWFGCSDATKDSYKEYRKIFREVLAKLSPEDYIAVVDCHI